MGLRSRTATVDVESDARDSDCWAGYREGETYLVYAYAQPEQTRSGAGTRPPAAVRDAVARRNRGLSTLYTGRCTRSGAAAERAGELEELRTLARRG
jgi:hypothetical protein